MSALFDDMGGRFSARLRAQQTLTHTSTARGESISVKSRIAVLEARFDLEVLDRLHKPCFVAIERRSGSGGKPSYLVYEVVGVTPTHFEMQAMTTALPTVVRKEYLDKIYVGWGVSDETWIDVVCTPTGYLLTSDEKGRPVFEKTLLSPLTGAPAHLLSQETTRSFLCVEGGTPIGTMVGFDIELTVDLDSLVKYHAGVFGFTGTGKSNLTSVLVRRILGGQDATVVVFDVAGEYAINLADKLAEAGVLYTTEELGDADALLDSQAVPETLEAKVDREKLRDWAQGLLDVKHVQRLRESATPTLSLTLGYILQHLKSTYEKQHAGNIIAYQLYNHIAELAEGAGLGAEVPAEDLPQEVREKIAEALGEAIQKLSDRAGLKEFLQLVAEALSQAKKGGRRGAKPPDTPEGVAARSVSEDSPPLIILHVPDPVRARLAASTFLASLLDLKKHGKRRRVVVVFDEAQEFVPYETRREDYTFDSSMAVEALLRQGRKYRAHCLIATQRVARLNTNALQQLHSYFVSTMPRYYDRMVIADTFSLNYEVLERTTELDTGEWLFVSFKATKQRNVPVFIKTPNNEDYLVAWFNNA